MEKGIKADFKEVFDNIRDRDYTDRTRKESPLRKADDARVLDNDGMTHAEQMDWLMNLYKSITARD